MPPTFKNGCSCKKWWLPGPSQVLTSPSLKGSTGSAASINQLISKTQPPWPHFFLDATSGRCYRIESRFNNGFPSTIRRAPAQPYLWTTADFAHYGCSVLCFLHYGWVYLEWLIIYCIFIIFVVAFHVSNDPESKCHCSSSYLVNPKLTLWFIVPRPQK